MKNHVLLHGSPDCTELQMFLSPNRFFIAYTIGCALKLKLCLPAMAGALLRQQPEIRPGHTGTYRVGDMQDVDDLKVFSGARADS
jgi:hypothetical protein